MNVLMSLLLSVPTFANTRTIIIRPGVSQTLNRQEFRRPNQDVIVLCEAEPTCHIGYEYVGKKYSLRMPNGKNFAFYRTKKEAISMASDLVSSKICDRVVLNIDNQKLEKRL